jgi:hypothetical protein
MSISKTAGTNKVTIAGGNLTCGGTLTFVNGLLLTGSNVLTLTPGGGSTGQGFDRAGVTGTNVSHVVGSVRKTVVGGVGANGRNEFPVGTGPTDTPPSVYRPVVLTFATAPGVTITVSHQPIRPTGTDGLPVTGGVAPGTDIARYPSFFWNISSNAGIGQAQFNLELTATGFTDFDDIANVRIIRRAGTASDASNTWSLQGPAYDNFVAGGVPTVVNVNSTGGVRPEGGIFTYGLTSSLFVSNAIANQTLPDGNHTFKRRLTNPAVFGGNTQSLTFSVSSSNTSVATATLSGDTLIVRGIVDGQSTITVTGQNLVDGVIRTAFIATVTGTTGVDARATILTEFSLDQNFPNPFNPSTSIRFALPKEAPVTFVIYNMLGVPVRTLVNGENLNAAYHQITWDGKDDAGVTLPSGVYLYRISAGVFQTAKKMTLLK